MTADELRALRARLGLSQAKLAREFGVSVATIANYEGGRSERRDCPVPRVVELACRWLEHEAKTKNSSVVFAELSREHIARYPKIRETLAKR